MFEFLESRRLFSNGIGSGAGGPDPGPAAFSWDAATATLTVTNVSSAQINDYNANGDPVDDVPGEIYLIDKSVVGTQTSVFTGVENLIVIGTRWKDFISVSLDNASNDLNVSIDGGAGADHLTVVNKGLNIVNIHGGNGNDSIFANSDGLGQTNVYGEGGRDTFASLPIGGPLDPDVNWLQ